MGEGGAGEGQGAAVDEATGFEVGIVVPKLYRGAAAGCGEVENCVARLVRELEDVGLIVERVRGVPAEFIKVRCFFFLLLLYFEFRRLARWPDFEFLRRGD